MSKTAIDLENFAEWHGSVDGVEMEAHLSLPSYIPAADIHVDLGRIARIGRTARFERISFSLYDESQDTSASVSGINADGSAVATAVKVARATRARGTVGRWYIRGDQFQKGEAHVRINASHPDMDDQVLRDPEPWAKLLDKGVRDGLKKAGKAQLLEPARLRAKNALKRKAWDGMVAAAATGISQDPGRFPYIVGAFMVLDAIDPLTRIIRRVSPDQLIDPEYSLIMGYPIDRYLATTVLTRTARLVTAK